MTYLIYEMGETLMENDNNDKFVNVKKFIREVKDFANKYVAYEKVEDAEKNTLDENGPLSEVFNKYMENGTIEKVERRFRAFCEGQCLIPRAEIEVSYLSNAYGMWKTFTIKI